MPLRLKANTLLSPAPFSIPKLFQINDCGHGVNVKKAQVKNAPKLCEICEMNNN